MDKRIVIFIFLSLCFISCAERQKADGITLPRDRPYINEEYNKFSVRMPHLINMEDRGIRYSSLIFTEKEDEPEIEKTLRKIARVKEGKAFSSSEIKDRTLSVVYGYYCGDFPEVGAGGLREDTVYYLKMMAYDINTLGPAYAFYPLAEIKTLKTAEFQRKIESMESKYEEANFYLFDNEIPFLNSSDTFQYDIPDEEIMNIARKHSFNLNINSAVSLNSLGYALYEQMKYEEAKTVLRKACVTSNLYKYAHYNLACVLALLNKNGREISPNELIFHLQYAGFLDINYFDKMRVDTDLESIWDEEYYKDFAGIIDHAYFTNLRYSPGDSHRLTISYNKREIFITYTREAVIDTPLPWADTWWDSTSLGDGKAAFFTSRYPEGPAFKYLLTYYGLLIRIPTEPIDWDRNGNDLRDWQEFQDPSKVVFRAVGYESGMIRLYYYDLFSGELHPIIETSYESGEYEFRDFDGIWFNSKNNIGFIGRIQNDTGKEYSINLDGSDLKLTPNGRTVYY